jgi:hypothetical protein
VTLVLADTCCPLVLVHVTEYVAVLLGETGTLPEVAFPVEKPVPVHEFVPVENHVS